MNRLLAANFSRLLKSKAFWVCCIYAFVYGIFMQVMNYLTTTASGEVPLMGSFDASSRLVFATCIGILIAVAAFASICTLISMLCQNRAVAAVINILLIFTMLFISIYIRAWLETPETISTQSVVMDENGVSSVTTEEVPNPMYLRGAKREVCKFINDFLPTGQTVQFTNMEAENIPILCGYSAIITAAVAGAGMTAFRKDIK